MKKRRPIFFAVFLALGILIVVVHHCKAEGWNPNDGDPWTPPDWAESTFEPPAGTVPPCHPEPTVSPSQEPLRGASTAQPTEAVVDDFYTPPRVSSEDYIFDVYTRVGMFTYNFNNPLILYMSSFNSSLSGLNGSLNPWPLYWDTFRYKEDLDINLKNYFSIPYSDTSNTGLGIRSGGYYYNFYLNPNIPLTNDKNVAIHLQHKIQIGFNYPTNANDVSIFQAVSPDISTLNNMPVSIFTRLMTSDGDYFDDYDTIPFNDLSDFIISLNFDSVPSEVSVVSIRVGVAINWFPFSNPVVLQFDDYYQKNNIAATYYPQYKFVPSGEAQIKVQITEDKEVNKSWLSKFLDSLFKPKYQNIKSIIDEYVFEPTGTSTSSDFVLDFREVLYGIFAEDTDDAQIVLPSIDIPLPNNNTAHILDGYTFNLSQFYQGDSHQSNRPFATLISGVRTLTSCLIGSLFFASLWEIFVTVFGLYKWSGVYSDKEDDES